MDVGMPAMLGQTARLGDRSRQGSRCPLQVQRTFHALHPANLNGWSQPTGTETMPMSWVMGASWEPVGATADHPSAWGGDPWAVGSPLPAPCLREASGSGVTPRQQSQVARLSLVIKNRWL